MTNREMIKKGILAYGREHRAVVAVYLTAAVLFYLVAGLYGYGESMKHMTYALFLVLVFGAAAGIAGCIRYIRHLGELLDAVQREGEQGEHLPPAYTMSEQCYQELIWKMEQERRMFLEEYDERKRIWRITILCGFTRSRRPLRRFGCFCRRKIAASRDRS